MIVDLSGFPGRSRPGIVGRNSVEVGIEEETRLIAGLGDDVVADSGWG